MAEDDRTFRTSTPAANRAEAQGLGVGQREMDAQRSPSREQQALDPNRPEPFDADLQATSGDDRGDGPSDSGAGDPSQGPDRERPAEERAFSGEGPGGGGELGEGTPANVDIHKLGQDDKPEQDWGDETDEGLTHSANHTRRGVKTEAERGQGAKTRQANKDIVSRRG